MNAKFGEVSSRVDGAILAGGNSTRMGEDKALLRLEPDGPTCLESIARSLAEVARRVAIVAPLNRGYLVEGTERVDDRYPGSGPLGGVATALAWSTTEST